MTTTVIRQNKTSVTFLTDTSDAANKEEAELFDAFDKSLRTRLLLMLDAQYPDYNFKVIVRHAQGSVWISLPEFNHDWGYHIPIKDLLDDPFLKAGMRAAGEYLDRYKLLPGKADPDRLADALARYNPTYLARFLRPPD